MKSLHQKRKEALDRTYKYVYDNSKAKRNGLREEVWEVETKKHIDHLESIESNDY